MEHSERGGRNGQEISSERWAEVQIMCNFVGWCKDMRLYFKCDEKPLEGFDREKT